MKALIVALTLCTTPVFAARFVVEANSRPIAPKGVQIESFYPTTHKYFSTLYVVSGNITLNEVKNLNVINAEEATEITKLSVIPADNSRRLVEDELFSYQWGLLNQGQTYLREKDDIHNLPLKGVAGKDIGFEFMQTQNLVERPIVAVLDSGVDLNHPELKDNLWKNSEECGKDPKVDNDGNKLAGDCNGWNFTEAIDSDEAKNPSDIDGHGTHVAGIIAAANNGDGIVGVMPNALIMPIKVMKDSESRSEVASSESFARGILYAVDNGAKVINMSLGWPKSLETKYLREAVLYALNQGVVIVAAAGNNNSVEPLFPCAYEGVICVAASTLDGTFAGFSNYGGHVDTIAPGEAILSTNPTLFEPDFFSVPGYEIRSGTSQAAPMVAGLVAGLLSKQTNLSIDDVLGRVYNLDKARDAKKYVMGGAATFEGLLRPVETPVIRPVLKRVRQILVRGTDARLVIPVRNFGTASGSFEVSLQSLSSALIIKTETQVVDALDKSAFKDVFFDLSVTDFTMESNVSVKITIKEGDKTHSYINEIPVLRNVTAEQAFTKISFAFGDKTLPVGSVRNAEVVSNLTTVESFEGSLKHEVYLRRFLKEDDKKLEITLFSRVGDKFQQATKNIEVPNAVSLVNFTRVDLNRDGIEDYMVHTVCEKNNKKFFTFSFFKANMEAMWPAFQHVALDIDIFVQSMNDLVFTGIDHPILGKINVPAFFTEGQLPKEDQVLTSWDRQDMGKKKRLFYLNVTRDLKFKIKALTTNVWEESVKKELSSKWYETVETEQLLPVTREDIRRGMLRTLVTVGQGTKRKLFIYSFNTKTVTHGAALPQLVLQTEEVDPLLAVTNQGLTFVGDVYFNIYDRERSKIVTTKGEAQESEYVYRHKSESDLIAGHLATFAVGTKKISVLQTREELVSITRGQGEKISKRPKLRYSFLGQKLLSEMYHPVIFERNGVKSPALYVDSTAVTGNRISLYEEQNGNLVSSIRNSIAVPGTCKALNPVFSEKSGAHDFVFLCLENNTDWVIRTYKMN